MEIWLISDTHFGHKNIERLCSRPSGWERVLEQNLQQINSEDVLIHLGDVAFNWKNLYNQRFLQLPCTKWLVRGNHDKRNCQWYIKNGWDICVNSFSFDYLGKTLLFTHTPKTNFEQDFNIHGHLHNNQEAPSTRHILVKLEHEYRPILLDEVIKNNT